MKTLLLFATLLPMSAQVPVEVRVVDASGSALAGARVDFAGDHGESLSGRTGADGTFVGTAPAGKHMLLVSRDGYRPNVDLVLNVVDLEPGKDYHTTIRMIPLAVVSGRVLDQYGDPLRNAIVRVIDLARDPGRGSYYRAFTSAVTDDRGEYRISSVEPGSYWVGVEYDFGDPARNLGMRSRYQWPHVGGIVFFPGATDISAAAKIEIAAAERKRLPDLRVNVQRAVSVSGRIKSMPRSAPSPAQRGMVGIERTGPNPGLNVFAVMGTSPGADGKFRFTALPGTYTLQASAGGKVAPPRTIEVSDKDLTDIELDLSTSYEVRGRFVIEGPERLDFSKVQLSLLGPDGKIEPGGTFHASLATNKAEYFLQKLPDNWYVKDVTLAGRRLTGSAFEVEPGTTDLVFTLSGRGASLDVTGDAVQVVLIPEEGDAPQVDRALGASPAQGMRTIRGIPPNTYRAYGVDMSSYLLLFDLDALRKKYRDQAPLITFAEGEHKTVHVTPLVIRP
jgi:hypothetical protein